MCLWTINNSKYKVQVSPVFEIDVIEMDTSLKLENWWVFHIITYSIARIKSYYSINIESKLDTNNVCSEVSLTKWGLGTKTYSVYTYAPIYCSICKTEEIIVSIIIPLNRNS